MTMQEAFNTAYRGVMSQGGKSMIGTSCRYRAPDGRKCGVGWLLDDDTAMRLDMAKGPGIKDHPEAAGRLGLPMGFLLYLQHAHDTAKDDLSDFPARMAAIAKRFGLEMPE